MNNDTDNLDALHTTLFEVIEQTDRSLEEWSDLADSIWVVAERLEMLATRLANLPCRSCGGQTLRQPVAPSPVPLDPMGGVFTYLTYAVLSAATDEMSWRGLFGPSVLGRVIDELQGDGVPFPADVAMLVRAASQACFAGWGSALDTAVGEGDFEVLIAEGTCDCLRP